jgi:hypothetical protein
MKTFDEIKLIVANCEYKPWRIVVRHPTPQIIYLQVYCDDGVCNVTGEKYSWHGRKWYISHHATETEIVNTALKAVLAAEEHEAREKFKYKGVAIYDPHTDVNALIDMHGKAKLDART